MPDKNDKGDKGDNGDRLQPMAQGALIKRDATDAIEPDPMSDEIERLQREAEPKPKLCPHCGKELPRE